LDELTAKIKKLAENWRPYAPFSARPGEKAWQELEMVRRLSESIGSGGEPAFRELTKYEGDTKEEPPIDVTGFDRDRKLVAFEVTELVDEMAINENVKRRDDSGSWTPLYRSGGVISRKWMPVYRSWTPETVIEKLEEIICEKDNKLRNASLEHFDRVVLVIHTDEFDLSPDRYIEVVREHLFARPKHIDEAYLVFSYWPAYKGYPYAPLRFE
jgi:hypothetical protein